MTSSQHTISARRLAGLSSTIALVLLAWASVLQAGPARADFGVTPGSFQADSFEADGVTPETRAGLTPAMAKTSFAFEREGATPVQNAKNVIVDLPPGFVGNLQAVPPCPRSLFNGGFVGDPPCPAQAQVGQVMITVKGAAGVAQVWTLPVYLLEGRGGDLAEFGFRFVTTQVHFFAELNPDGSLRAVVPELNEQLPVLASELTLWGVPADPVYTPERKLSCSGSEAAPRTTCLGGNVASGLPLRPFWRTPTACGPAHTTTIRAESWQNPGSWVTDSFTTASGATECEQLPFDPRARVKPTERAAGAPTGLAVDLDVPQDFANPSTRTTAHVKDVRLELPAGMTVNGATASGLVGCAEGQIGLGLRDPSRCPAASRIGTVEVETPLIEQKLSGGVFLAEQTKNPFGTTLALYLVLRSAERGVELKLAGKVETDPQTGQLTVTFDDNPQLPFSRLHVELKTGPRAPLVTPAACGTYTTRSQLTSWARPNEVVESASTFTIDRNCDAANRFAPGLRAGTVNPVAGEHSPFVLRVTREDGEQNVSRIDATLPEGVLARLAGVPLCPEAGASTGACPAASQIGATTVGIGAGASPLFVPQPGKAPTAVYLAGPYKGAPYSLVVKVPAQAGPFDLGTVAVRSGIYVDPVSTAVSVKSDPLPQILEGIPIAYRDVRVEIDRPGFTLNPTSCEPMAVTSAITSVGGALANPVSRFQVADCERLAFKPKLALRFFGKTHRSAYPRLRATLTMPKGQANIAKTTVLMPKTELLEQNHIRTLCTREQWAQDNCPKASIYGKAKAWTPLLDKPLQGNVYLRSNGGARELPDLVADLRGQIDIELVGYIDAVNARLRARFVNVPDAPVSKFVLQMQGGKKGLLAHNTNVCKTKPRASVKFDGQNGKVHDYRPVVRVGCGKKQ